MDWPLLQTIAVVGSGAVVTLSAAANLSRMFVTRQELDKAMNDNVAGLAREYVTHEHLNATIAQLREEYRQTRDDIRDLGKRVDDMPERIVTLMRGGNNG